MLSQFQTLFSWIVSSLNSFLNVNEPRSTPASLSERMKAYTNQQHNVYCHPFRPHIVSLKSTMLTRIINKVMSFDEKKAFYEKYNGALQKVATLLYNRFDPHLMYTFNNEIHLVFYPNDEGVYLYDGRVSRIITTIASCASVEMTKVIAELGDFSVDSCVFEANFVEFSRDWEALNYLLWRQYDCKRNSMTLLYKCLNKDLVEDGQDPTCFVKLDEILWELLDMDVPESIICGTIMKKKLDSTTFRKHLVTLHENWHMFDFKHTLNTYVVDKYLHSDTDDDELSLHE